LKLLQLQYFFCVVIKIYIPRQYVAI
jgi:hypothetical protein